MTTRLTKDGRKVSLLGYGAMRLPTVDGLNAAGGEGFLRALNNIHVLLNELAHVAVGFPQLADYGALAVSCVEEGGDPFCRFQPLLKLRREGSGS